MTDVLSRPSKPSLKYFRRILELGRDDDGHSVLSAIALVDAVWSFSDADFSSFTYVVVLRNGERAAIHYIKHKLPENANEGLTFRRLAKCAPLPPMDGDARGWSIDVGHLNNYIARQR